MKIKLLSVLLLAGVLIAACGDNKGKKESDKNESDTKIMEEQKTLTNVHVLIETTEGNIKIRLYDQTPLHRDNFVKLVESKFYDGVIFHRVIKNFMIQGGDPDSKNPVAEKRYGSGGPGYTIPAEIDSSLIHKKGALAAARTGDATNPKRASSGSQFYIVQGDKFNANEVNPGFKYTAEQLETYKTIGGTPHLDGAYTIFGEVVEGIDVVDKIAAVKTGVADRPIKDVVITKMEIVK